MFERFKALFRSHDDLPVTLSAIVGRDACSRMLTEFNERDLKNCQSAIIVWEDCKGDVNVITSGNVDEVRASGLLGIASGMVNGKQG